jgi:AsmA protein
MTRRSLFVVALSSCMVLAAAGIPWTVTTATIADRVARQVKALTGLDLKVDGRATFALLPLPRIKLENATFFDGAGAEAVVRASQLRGELRLLPLLAGQIEIADATLLEPIVTLRADGSEHAVVDALLGRLAREAEAERAADSRLHVGRLVIVNGTFRRLSEATAARETVTDINAVIGWSTAASPVDIAATFGWRGKTVEARIEAPSPARLLAGKPAHLSLRLKSPLATLAVSGEISGGRDLQLAGYLSLASTSFDETERWLDLGLPLAPFIEAMSLEGPLTASARGLLMNSATVRLGDDRLEGALTGRIDEGRLSLSGTFAAERLDLGRYLAPLAPQRATDGGWNAEPFDVGTFTGADVDLRLSATSAQLGRMRLDNAAGGLIMKSGRLEFTLARAEAWRGTLKGRFSLAATPAGMESKLQGSFDHIDMLAALGDGFELKRLSGWGTGQFALDAAGPSFAELARTASGKASFAVKQGEIVGLNLGEAARRSERRPLSAPIDWHGGRTSFDALTASFGVAGGIAELAEASLVSSAFKATLGGRVFLADRSFDMRGHVSTVLGSGTVGAGLPFDVVGGWDDPSITPNVRSLIQRSGAAAPLLNIPPPGLPAALSLDLVPRRQPD